MTVRELIAKLQQVDPGAEVYRTTDYSENPVETIEVVTRWTMDGTDYYLHWGDDASAPWIRPGYHRDGLGVLLT